MGSFILSSSILRILPGPTPCKLSLRHSPSLQGAGWRKVLLVPYLLLSFSLLYHLLLIFWAAMQDKSILGWKWQGLK